MNTLLSDRARRYLQLTDDIEEQQSFIDAAVARMARTERLELVRRLPRSARGAYWQSVMRQRKRSGGAA